MFPFLCPSRGQLPPVGWGRSVVITYLDNRRAAQKGRTLVERRAKKLGTLHDMVKTYQVCRSFATLSKRQQSVRRT